jgi:predicted transport protein
MKHVPLKTIRLKNHPQYSEQWLQDVIASDPSILNIGDVILRDRERLQPGAGRLDLLFQDADDFGRYEVEIQLGATDESHIIRALEYWDLERRRYPQYDHTAVLIAEDITSRFLNVISLFNGFIPIMALQLTAIEVPEGIGLQFTKVLDTVRLGYVDEDETAEPTDRNYWENKRGTPKTVKMADKIFEICKEFASSLEQTYNKYYIGFKDNGKPYNFIYIKPQKSMLRLEIGLPQDVKIDEQLESAGIDILDYKKRSGRYIIRLTDPDIKAHREMLRNLFEQAYQRRA